MEVIRDARLQGGLAMAAITLLELACIAENGRIETTLSVESLVRACASKTTVLPITPEIAGAVSLPASYPKDPQDLLIGATALVEVIQLVTHDKQINKYSQTSRLHPERIHKKYVAQEQTQPREDPGLRPDRR